MDIEPSLICSAIFLGSLLDVGAIPGILVLEALGFIEGGDGGLIEGIDGIVGPLIGFIALISSINFSNLELKVSIAISYHVLTLIVETPFLSDTNIVLANEDFASDA